MISPTNYTKGETVVEDEETILRKLNSNVINNLIVNTGNLEATVDTSPISVVGRLNKVFAGRIASLQQLVRDIELSMYVETSTGVSLSKLAMIVGFPRKTPSPSLGQVLVTTDNNLLIPDNTIFSSLRGDEFRTTEDHLISIESCIGFSLELHHAVAGRAYTITIENRTYVSREADPITDLFNQINDDDPVTHVTLIDGVIRFDKKDATSNMRCEVSSLLIPSLVKVEIRVQSVENGLIFGDADTITNIVTPLTGLHAVENLHDFLLGGDLETDEELRERVKSGFNTLGTSTLDTIEASLLQVPSVQSVFVDENRTFETDANNVPSKSYEVIIHHTGDNVEDIAKTVWDNKPLGILSHGENSFFVEDERGVPQEIKYTLARPREVWFRVRYTELQNDLEEVPEDIVPTIQDVITIEGQNYKANQDVIGKRFYGVVFRNTSGISELDVQVCLTEVGATQPTASQFRPRWTVARNEIATFATNRIQVIRNI